MLSSNGEPDWLYLVDGSGLAFRAFYALPSTLTRPDGQPINAVLGFINMILKLFGERSIGLMAICFDHQTPTFRHRLYPAYKANRKPPPADLISQFPIIIQAGTAFGIQGLQQPGYEADDLIATYTRIAGQAHVPVMIVSSDKDLMQLIGQQVKMLDPATHKIVTAEQVRQKFGVQPTELVDLQALAGDSCDNIPGIPGIGPVTAARLIHQFGDLKTALAQADTIKQSRVRRLVQTYREQALLSQQLASLDQQVPVTLELEQLRPALEPAKLTEFLKIQGFNSILARWQQQGLSIPSAQPR